MTAPRTILHLGLGAFHRAHQAAYLQRLIDAGDASWRIAAGDIRAGQEKMVAALQASGGRYTLETVRSNGERDYCLIEAIDTVVAFEPSLAELIRLGSDPNTKIVSFTVTEAGYCLDGRLEFDASNADVVADIAAAQRQEPGRTIYGAIAAILRARRAANAGPVTLMSCDNLRDNGARFRRGLLLFLDLADERGLRAWVERNTRCPNSMVDRITPRQPEELRARVGAATGRDDRAAVMAEQFCQWVIEDDFAAERPAWQDAGAEIVASVSPYEEAKIRILNASHSAIAWAGTLSGHRYVHEAIADPRISAMVDAFVTEDVLPCLEPSPVDLRRYRDVVFERFANASIADTIERVRSDSRAKLQGFVLPTIRECLVRGVSIDAAAMLPALYLAAALRLRAIGVASDSANMPLAGDAMQGDRDPVGTFCGDASLWGDLAGDGRLAAALRTAFERSALFD